MTEFLDMGKSIDDPVEIEKTSTTTDAIEVEYQHIESIYGQQTKQWKLVYQALHNYNSQYIDELVIQLYNGTKISFFFNITQFF